MNTVTAGDGGEGESWLWTVRISSSDWAGNEQDARVLKHH